MKTIIGLMSLLIGASAIAQDEFQLDYNDEKKVHYQGVVENADAVSSDLFQKAIAWIQNTDRTQSITFKDEVVNKIVAKSEFATVGKSNYYSNKEYYYVFSCEMTLEFKEGKTRYTLTNFKKKTSPGEPGSTIEYFIANYKPEISSKKQRDKYAKMLDEIELAIQDQIWDLVDDIKKTFGPQEAEKDSDW